MWGQGVFSFLNLPLNLPNTKWNFLSQAPILQALQCVPASCDEPTK